MRPVPYRWSSFYIQFGNKFSFALYFDKDLNFLPDMTFFTESAYIRYFKEVPNQEAFREFEDELKQSFTQDFDGTAASPKKFNEAFPKAKDVKVHDDPAIFLGRDLLFFHFMPEQGVKILLLEAVRREGRRVLDPDVPLRQMLHHDPRFQNFFFLDHFLNTAPPGLLSAL